MSKEPSETPDLMAALEESLRDCDYAEADWCCVRPQGHKGPHWSPRIGRDDGGEDA